MPKSAAKEAAFVDSSSETTDGSNEIYGHHLQLVSVTKSHDPTGNPAWQAKFKDLTQNGELLCIWMANGQYSGSLSLQPCPKARKGP
jgi:L-amino acid N-acyltransferase YncA